MFPTLAVGWAAGDAGLQRRSKVPADTSYAVTPEILCWDTRNHGSTWGPGAGRVKRLMSRRNPCGKRFSCSEDPDTVLPMVLCTHRPWTWIGWGIGRGEANIGNKPLTRFHLTDGGPACPPDRAACSDGTLPGAGVPEPAAVRNLKFH